MRFCLKIPLILSYLHLPFFHTHPITMIIINSEKHAKVQEKGVDVSTNVYADSYMITTYRSFFSRPLKLIEIRWRCCWKRLDARGSNAALYLASSWLNDQTIRSFLRTYTPGLTAVIITPQIQASSPAIARKNEASSSSLWERTHLHASSLSIILAIVVYTRIYVWDVSGLIMHLVDSLQPPMHDSYDVLFMTSFLGSVWPNTTWNS